MPEIIKEVIVVEGRSDVAAVKNAVKADCLITNGFHFGNRIMKDLKAAYEKRGLIILTDPDSAGENIRAYLAKKFPKAKHAFVSVDEATSKGDVGIEDASPESIRRALQKVKTVVPAPKEIFSTADMMKASLSGTKSASNRRAVIGAALGIGFANAKVFLKRLNAYGISREEFTAAIEDLK